MTSRWDFEEDPYLDRVREVCLAFPEAHEKEAHGQPTFRARAMFAVYGAQVKNPHGPMIRRQHSILVKADDADRPALEQDPRVFVPAYYGPGGWLGLDLDAAPVDWQEIAELVDGSYRLVSGPRLVALLDAAGSPAHPPRRPGEQRGSEQRGSEQR